MCVEDPIPEVVTRLTVHAVGLGIGQQELEALGLKILHISDNRHYSFAEGDGVFAKLVADGPFRIEGNQLELDGEVKSS